MREKAAKVLRTAGWASRWPAARPLDRVTMRQVDLNACDTPLNAGNSITEIRGDLSVEPKWGYATTRRGRVLMESVETNNGYDVQSWRIALPDWPPSRYFDEAAASRLDGPVVSLRHWWEWNYFHFFMDVLGKLSLLDAAGLLEGTPLLVGDYVNDVPFAREALEMGDMPSLNWVIPGGRAVRTSSLYIPRTKEPHRPRLDFALDRMGIPARPSGDRRVYLSRRSAPNRRVTNEAEVAALLAGYGFEVVATEGMSLRDQAAMFGSTRYLIAIHGAGITNIMFRRGSPMDVMELHSDEYHTTSYMQICAESGYRWSALACAAQGKGGQIADIAVDLKALEQRVCRMLGAEAAVAPA
jgi:capsular polysaccharide biosynthesis protein